MSIIGTRQINIKCPADLADLVDDVVTDAPFIGNRSTLLRHGLTLALRDLNARGVVRNPEIKQRIDAYLIDNTTYASEQEVTNN